MKTIDTFWEKRNLGVTSVEVAIDAADSVEEIEKTLRSLNVQYQVIRSPVCRLDLYSTLCNMGFSFVETMLNIYFDFDVFEINWGKYDDRVFYKELTEEKDMETVYHHVLNGMFKNDRISLDQRFGQEAANKRYMGMIQDKLAQGAKFCSLVNQDGRNIGFFGARETADKIYDFFLTGIYGEFQGKGFGSNTYTQALAYMKSKGAKIAVGRVSMNNAGSYKISARSGFQLDCAEYLFVKHRA